MDFPHPVEERITLASLTTLEVGGPARYLARCGNARELVDTLAVARDRGLGIFLLGGGSNLLAADRGFDGLVVRITDETLAFEPAADKVLVRAGAGVGWDRLVARTVAAGLGGLECLSGIPGRVGAAPIQNIGAYGQEVSETIVAVRTIELATGKARSLTADECGFGYRHSRFKSRWRDRDAVVGVDFLLERRCRGAVRYPDLRRRFEGREAPRLTEVREAVLEIRRGKSMMLDPADPNRRSAGSFFVNPTVTPEAAREVRERLEPSGGRMPAYPAAGGGVKLAAAWLIERAGFHRGYRLGQAAISTHHALALVNTGGATAAEIVALASRIRRGVRDACGVVLEPEPIFLGFDAAIDELLD